jgi:RNA-directed DNA polymerase
LRLKVNRDKSAVARPSERKFLGYTLSRQRKPQLMVAPKSVQRLKAKLRPLFRQGRGMKLADTIARINRITRGWVAYYLSSIDTNRRTSGHCAGGPRGAVLGRRASAHSG